MSTSLADAFATFGATLESPVHGRSAIAGDGALVLSCSILCFHRPGPGVLRYEDLLSRDPASKKNTALLGEHLTLARDGALPVRMVVIARALEGKPRRNIYARPDLVGRLSKFDGDRFIIDFTRLPVEPPRPLASHRNRRGV